MDERKLQRNTDNGDAYPQGQVTLNRRPPKRVRTSGRWTCGRRHHVVVVGETKLVAPERLHLYIRTMNYGCSTPDHGHCLTRREQDEGDCKLAVPVPLRSVNICISDSARLIVDEKRGLPQASLGKAEQGLLTALMRHEDDTRNCRSGKLDRLAGRNTGDMHKRTRTHEPRVDAGTYPGTQNPLQGAFSKGRREARLRREQERERDRERDRERRAKSKERG